MQKVIFDARPQRGNLWFAFTPGRNTVRATEALNQLSSSYPRLFYSDVSR